MRRRYRSRCQAEEQAAVIPPDERIYKIPQCWALTGLNEHEFRRRLNDPKDFLRQCVTQVSKRVRYMTGADIKKYKAWLRQQTLLRYGQA